MSPVRQLSPNAKAQIKALSGARPATFLFTAATTWATIALAIGAAIHFHNIFLSIFAIYIVATRQNLLGLLIHEQTHYLGLKSRYGDWIVNLLVAFPLLAISIEGYSKIHLRHHRFYFTQQDPDFLRKNGEDWTFPMKPGQLAKLFLADVSGLSFLRFVTKREKFVDDGSFKRRNPTPGWLRLSFLAVLATVLTLVGGWGYFLLYWMLPMVTVLFAIIRWGAICEHVYGEEGASVEATSPVIRTTTFAKIFLPNLNFAMHPYHHYFPGVSFSNLPALHAVFEREGLVYQPMVFRSQFQYLRYLLGGSKDGVPARPLADATA